MCLVFEAGRCLMWMAVFSCCLLSCFANCLPFLSCLPPLTCVPGLTGSDVYLSQQKLQKRDSLEIQAVVDSTNTLKSSHTTLLKKNNGNRITHVQKKGLERKKTKVRRQ